MLAGGYSINELGNWLGDVALGLWQRAWIFLKRAGTTIALTVALLWVLATYLLFQMRAAELDSPRGEQAEPLRDSGTGT